MSVVTPVVDSWDGEARRIYLKQGVTTFHCIEDIYREYIHERAINEGLRKWYPLLKASGNEPKGGGKYTPRYITLIAGTRIVPYDENVLVEVKGEAITDNADIDPDPFDTSNRTYPLKLYITPPASELVQISSGSGLSEEEHEKLLSVPSTTEIINCVWDEPVSIHRESGSLGEFINSKILTTLKFIGLK